MREKSRNEKQTSTCVHTNFIILAHTLRVERVGDEKINVVNEFNNGKIIRIRGIR